MKNKIQPIRTMKAMDSEGTEDNDSYNNNRFMALVGKHENGDEGNVPPTPKRFKTRSRLFSKFHCNLEK